MQNGELAHGGGNDAMHPAIADSLQGPHEHNYHVQRVSGITQQTRRLDRNKTYGEIKRSVASCGIKRVFDGDDEFLYRSVL